MTSMYVDTGIALNKLGKCEYKVKQQNDDKTTL